MNNGSGRATTLDVSYYERKPFVYSWIAFWIEQCFRHLLSTYCVLGSRNTAENEVKFLPSWTYKRGVGNKQINSDSYNTSAGDRCCGKNEAFTKIKLTGTEPIEDLSLSLSLCPQTWESSLTWKSISILFYSGLPLIGCGQPRLGRAICFTQEGNFDVSFTPTHPPGRTQNKAVEKDRFGWKEWRV